MKFTKMEGLGNDYVYINCFEERVDDPKELAVRLSDRHFGIGGDGLILIKPSKVADFTMEMYNADGTQSEMCGNGIRCVGKYVYDYKLTNKSKITVETLAGIKTLEFFIKDEKVEMVKVNMGQPILKPEEIPVDKAFWGKTMMLNEDIEVNKNKYKATCVSMGNPHCIIFVDNVNDIKIEEIGPKFENHIWFPKRINTEFIEVINKDTIKMRVWERGTGETLACGTGACASVVAGILNNKLNRNVKVILIGGELIVEWDEITNHVYMTGPAKVVFDGEFTK